MNYMQMANQSDFHLSKMPYDVLLEVSNNLDAKDILFGISGADSRMHKAFSDENFWRSRFKTRYPRLFDSTDASQFKMYTPSTFVDQNCYWKKRCFYREKIQNSFDWKDRRKQSISKMRVATWAIQAMDGYIDTEDEVEDVDFACMTFCNSGRILAAADCRQNILNCWNIDKTDEDPQLPAPLLIRDLHKELDVTGEKICSLRALENRVSTGASDGTLVITDLKVQAPVMTFRSKERILSHMWQPNLIVVGTFNGSIEVFDERRPSPVFTKKYVMDGAERYDGIEVEIADNQMLAAGWIGESRCIKLLDNRTGEVLAETKVPDIVLASLGPAGHWGQRDRRRACIQISENSLWFGAENGKIFEYDLKSLNLLSDLTSSLGHERHIAGLHHAYGYIVSVSHGGRSTSNSFYEITVHDLGKQIPELIWKHDQNTSMIGSLSSVAFYPERCFLAIALTNEVKIWRPP